MGYKVRSVRSLIAAGAVAVLAMAAGCGPSGTDSAPSSGPTTPAVQATALSVHAADMSVLYGSGVEVTFALRANGAGLPPGATATVSVGSAVVARQAAVAADGTGSVELAASTLTPGSHVVTVAYAGDEAFTAATGKTTITVAPATSTVALSLTPLDTGATTAAAAVQTATGVPAAGKVVLAVDGAPAGEVAVVDGAGAMDIPAGLAIGDHTVDAVFTPDAADQVAGSTATGVLTISKTATTVMAAAAAAAVRYGDHSTFAVSVIPTGPPADLTGGITVTAGGTTVAQGTTDAAGAASLEFYNTLDPGTQTLSVNYAGNDRVAPAAADFTLESTRTTVDVGIDKPSLKVGESGTVTVSVVGTPQTPSGTATVTYDGAVIADGALDGDGRITAPVNSAVAGSHTIAVSYSGDVRFEGSEASSTLKVKQPLVNPNADAAAAINADNPCPATAAACVDLAHEKAWLQSGGEVTYGPVSITSGRSGYRTPAGTFSAYWFDKDHKSSIYEDAPMPNSVFFNNDIAFHQGSLSQQSHGCIHLSSSASATFFNALSVGDTVYVWGSAPY